MGRPATRSGKIVSVNINGKGVAWIDGRFIGDAEIVAHADEMTDLSLPVYINGVTVKAGSDNPNSAFAAMYSYNPDQTVIVEAPIETITLATVGIALPELV